MKKVLLAGGTGNLGRHIAAQLKAQGYHTTALVRNMERASVLEGIADELVVADVTRPATFAGICARMDVVVSSLGKSVSPNDRSRPSFHDIDLVANRGILQDAQKHGVKKFVYVSAFGAEHNTHLEYFKAHHDMSEEIKSSGINYSIIQPPAIFSSFIDLMEMARKGRLVTIGKGDKRTNPIYEGDLAKVCVDSIDEDNTEISAGGRNVYTRRQINELIQAAIAPSKKVWGVPVGLFRLSLPMMKIIDKNSYDKFAFFLEVMQHDLLTPYVGSLSLEEYIERYKNGTGGTP